MDKIKLFLDKLVRWTYKVTMGVLLSTLVLLVGWLVWLENFSQYAIDNKVQQVYKNIVAASGLSTLALPLYIGESDENNAYCDGTKIVIFRGLIDNSSWDAIAWTLGHELAHYHLNHTDMLALYSDTKRQERSEALADKLGAFYMMKAGYDLCEARKEWKQLRLEKGNYLGENHPNYSYRYDELNIGCE